MKRERWPEERRSSGANQRALRKVVGDMFFIAAPMVAVRDYGFTCPWFDLNARLDSVRARDALLRLQLDDSDSESDSAAGASAGSLTIVTGTGAACSISCDTEPCSARRSLPMPRAPMITASQP